MDEKLEKFKHLPFKNEEIKEKTVLKKHGGGESPKNQDRITHGQELQENLKNSINEIKNIKDVQKIYPPELDPSLIFVINQEINPTNNKYYQVDDDDIQKSDLEILDRESDRYFVVFASDGKANAFQERLKKYISDPIKSRIGNPPLAFFSNIKSCEHIKDIDKLGPILRKLFEDNESPKETKKVRIDFWWTKEETVKKIMDICIEKIESKKGIIIEKYIQYGIASLVAYISLEILIEIMKFTEILSIESVVEREIVRDITKYTIKELPPKNLEGIESKQIVCLIDTGIVENHPVIEGTVIDHILKTKDTSIVADEDGHGTFLTGNILYTNLETAIRSDELIPEARIISVKIASNFISKNISDFNSRIIEAIEEVFKNYGCKIFILTYLPINKEYQEIPKAKDHQLSVLLDRLINEKNILVIIPAGNILLEEYIDDNIQQNQLFYGNYLNYSLSKRVFEGASANNVLTVGSLAGKDSLTTLDPGLNPSSINFFATKNDIAPDSRTGPGLGDSIKPDLCIQGGNLVYRPSINPIVVPINSTMYIGPNRGYLTEDLFIFDSGTCIAACMVASICAKLLRFYPDHTSNFYRALIANRLDKIDFSNYTKLNTNVMKDKKSLLHLTGYGTINENLLYYGNEHTITLFFEGEINLDDFHVFKIPIPDSFKNTNGERRITVSLAYNPYVQYRSKYRAIRMEFDYIYDKCTIKEIVEKFNKLDSDNPSDDKKIKSESKNQFSVDISSTVRNNSTLQVARYTWLRFSPREKMKRQNMLRASHFIVVKCNCQNWFKFNANALLHKKQAYSLVVTIWHQNVNQIYADVFNEISVPEHVRAFSI